MRFWLMELLRYHSPSPFGFMQGTVLDAGDILEPDVEAWAESETDPLLGD